MLTHRMRSAISKGPTPAFSFVASNSIYTSTASTPTETQIGDIILCINTADGTTSYPGLIVPSGFTLIDNFLNNFIMPTYPVTVRYERYSLLYKVATENGSISVTGMGGGALSFLILRPIDFTISSISVQSLNTNIGSSIVFDTTPSGSAKTLPIIFPVVNSYGPFPTVTTDPKFSYDSNNLVYYSSSKEVGTIWNATVTGQSAMSSFYLEVT